MVGGWRNGLCRVLGQWGCRLGKWQIIWGVGEIEAKRLGQLMANSGVGANWLMEVMAVGGYMRGLGRLVDGGYGSWRLYEGVGAIGGWRLW